FVIYLSGASKLDIYVETTKLFVNVAGSSELFIQGRADNLKASIEGTGLLKAFDLMVKDANVEAVGTGGARLNVSKTLTAKASGTCKIRYKGKPTQINADAKGLSSIKQEF
ncbi:MAG: DUF2807 domain-containing protein, partial [Verrucomicrobia bacterium]|nr:DUF2807 domain-containing protein [Cytophagales bacterium]